MVCVVELDPVAIDEADGRVGTECGDRELFHEISPNLKMCVLLPLGLVCLRLCGSRFRNLTAGTPRGRLVVRFAVFRLDSEGLSAGRFRG
jgi:hypothetical protein